MDEIHGIKARTFLKVFSRSKAFYRYGMSGTIPKKAEYLFPLRAATGKIFFEKKAAELGKEGYIEIPTIVWEAMPFVSRIHKFVNWQDVYAQGVVQCAERHKLIADIVKRHEGQQILISIEHIAHGENILNTLKSEGIKEAIFVHNSVKERETIIQGFIQCEIKVLISSRILNMSITIPELEILINAAGRKSMIELVQRAGRPLGKGSKPKQVKIYEIIDSHNSYLFKHAKERARVYKAEKYPQEGLEKFKEY
jgi:superfamily II DNA or RNA helicase